MTNRTATIDDLYGAPNDGIYELVGGRLVYAPPAGVRPGRMAGAIAFALARYERGTRRGYAFGSNVGFIVDLPLRQSFSPDAAYKYDATMESDDFATGAPDFAVEVRSKGDYGPAMNAAYAVKRADYFAAGTRVVWDVSPRDRTIACYSADAPDALRIFAEGQTADAEPALPGWRVAVDTLFR